MRLPRVVVVLGLVFYVMAAIAGTCYYVIEVRRVPESQANWIIGLMLAVVLAPVLVYLFRDELPLTRVRTRGKNAERDRAIEMRIGTLGAVPGAAAFFPLLRTGYPLSDEALLRLIARAEALAAVPHRAKYVSWIHMAREISDEQIDYLELPERMALCEHFRELEVAGKQAGLLRLIGPGAVEGSFVFNRHDAALPDCIECTYHPVSHPREMDDYHQLTCKLCHTTLTSNGVGPRWPSGPAGYTIDASQ